MAARRYIYVGGASQPTIAMDSGVVFRVASFNFGIDQKMLGGTGQHQLNKPKESTTMRDMAKFADLCHDMVAEVDAHILFGCEVRGKEVVSQYDAGNVPASALRCISALERGRRRWQRDDIFTLVVLLSLPSTSSLRISILFVAPALLKSL